MQDLGKYLLKHVSTDTKHATNRFEIVDKMFDSWMSEKGVTDLSSETGKFTSIKQGANGTFSRKLTQNELGSLREILLIEIFENEHAFVTELRIGLVDNSVFIYCSLSAKRLSQIIAPVRIHPRCPRIIREIIEKFDDWELDGDKIPSSSIINSNGEDGGLALCTRLLDKGRRFPVLVISDDLDERPWPNLAEKLARDLVGVAHVAVVDDEGSWAMTDELGKRDSCYLGAVRLYWPLGEKDYLSSSIWTASKLWDEYSGDIPGLGRFQSTIRGIVLETSSLSLSAPKSLREISKREMRDRLNAANAEEKEKDLNSIIDENSELNDKLEAANAEILKLKSRIAFLSSKLDDGDPDKDTNSPEDCETEIAHSPVGEGQIRYYKKIGKKGDTDTLVCVKQCNHNSWRPAFKAIQAEKGITKLEGRSDWRSIQHCNGCKGGGRWKVQW
jgi:hypothetical protein